MKSLVVASGLALGLFGLADTASAQVIVSPGYGYGGGYYARPAYGYGGYAPHHHHHHQNYNYYPRSSFSFNYGYPSYGYGYRPWGYPGYGYGYPPGVSFGLTIIR